MPNDNPWAWWRAALDNPAEIGNSLGVHDGDPQQGYYRTRFKGGKWEPVAIWNEGGEWFALRSDRSVRADEIWTFCCRQPISYEAYEKAVASGEWDDEPTAKPRGIGDNLPDDPCEALAIEFSGEKELADEFLLKPITEQAQADRAAVLSKRIAAIAKKATDLHKIEKQPHLDAGRAVDDRWRALKEDPDALSKRLKRHMDDFLREQQRIEQERQRKAREEADRARRAAEDASRRATESDQQSEQQRAAARAEAERQAALARAAEQEAEARKVNAGRTGSRVSIRIEKVGVVTDYAKAAAALVAMKHKDLIEIIDKLAQRAAKAGMPFDGMEIRDEERVV